MQQRLIARVYALRSRVESMDLNPREAAFVLDEMSEIENSEGRYTSEKRAAARIRRKAEAVLTE